MNKKQKNKLQQQRAITLIALIITIIVLIILAGVAVNLTLGQNGLFTKAKMASENYKIAKEKEELQLEIADIQTQTIQEEGRVATLQDLYNKIDKIKYTIEIRNDEIADVDGTIVNPTYAVVNKKESNIYFTVDKKLEITKVEIKEKVPPKEEKVKISNITWANGKAQIELTTKEEGTIEYKVEKDGIYQAGTTISNLNNGDMVYTRVNNNGIYTDEEQKEIKDTIIPEEFTIEATDITYEGVKLIGETTDNQTGIKDYTYVAAKEGSIIKEIPNQTATEYTIIGLNEKTEYVVYMLAYDNAGNVRKSNEVTVITKEKPLVSVFDFTNNKNEFEDIRGNCIVDENGIKAGTFASSSNDVWNRAITKINKDIDLNLYSKFEIAADIVLEDNDTNYKMGGVRIDLCNGEDVIAYIVVEDDWERTQCIVTAASVGGPTEICNIQETKIQASGEYKLVSDGTKIKALLNDTVLGEIDYIKIGKCDNIKISFLEYPSHGTPTTYLRRLSIKTEL